MGNSNLSSKGTDIIKCSQIWKLGDGIRYSSAL